MIKSRILLLGVVSLALLTACSNLEGRITYEPPFIPVELSVDTHGRISITSDAAKITTFIGTFSLDASYTIPKEHKDDFIVVIRNAQLPASKAQNSGN